MKQAIGHGGWGLFPLFPEVFFVDFKQYVFEKLSMGGKIFDIGGDVKHSQEKDGSLQGEIDRVRPVISIF